jgi:hypothetical protein
MLKNPRSFKARRFGKKSKPHIFWSQEEQIWKSVNTPIVPRERRQVEGFCDYLTCHSSTFW